VREGAVLMSDGYEVYNKIAQATRWCTWVLGALPTLLP
jgi:hypothetical protein